MSVGTNNEGNSPISPGGVGQDDPSVYFDANEENAENAQQVNNNILDGSQHEKVWLILLYFSDILNYTQACCLKYIMATGAFLHDQHYVLHFTKCY